MYGLLHCGLAEMIALKFGDETWNKILRAAGIELGGGTFMTHRRYSDDLTHKLLVCSAKVTGTSYDDILDMFGEHFLKYAMESGYDRLLKVLGGNLYDLLCNLDVFHDHLTTIFPRMRAPSFRCNPAEDGSLVLHYYSERKGYEHFVMGMIKAVARDFFDTIIKVTVMTTKGKKCDHTVLTIKEEQTPAVVIRKRSCSLVSQLQKSRNSTNPRELQIGIQSFCRALPFHMVLDRKLNIVQVGASLYRILKSCQKGAAAPDNSKRCYHFEDIFEVVRPVIVNVSFDTILDNLSTVFIVRTRPGVIEPSEEVICDRSPIIMSSSNQRRESITPRMPSNHRRESISRWDPNAKRESIIFNIEDTCMRLKGQMVFVPESDKILFLCSPRVMDIDDLSASGLYLSDIPIHDATRDLILITQARRAERQLVEKLEETTNNLRKLQCRLQEDKRRTDELLHSILPSNVAERLRLNQSVEAEKFGLVSVLVSDIVGFTTMCGDERVVPMDIVRLLNKLYTQFDHLCSVHDVYKVETIGDAYLVVAGIPVYISDHADRVTSMAFSMQRVADTVTTPIDGQPIQIRIGIHSGPCVAGVVGQKMPRYCLFGDTVAVASMLESRSLPGNINMSTTTMSYLSDLSQYMFEENLTRPDLLAKCYFVYTRNEGAGRREPPADLVLPINKGLFRTPTPSPSGTPVDDVIVVTSPPKVNSPDYRTTKFKTPAIQIFDADDNSVKKAAMIGEMSDLHSKMDLLSNISTTGPKEGNSSGNNVISNSINISNNTLHSTQDKDYGGRGGCVMVGNNNVSDKQQQQQKQQQKQQQQGCDNVTIDTTNVAPSSGGAGDGGKSKKKANRPANLSNVQPISTFGYSSKNSTENSVECKNSERNAKSKDIETWLVNVPVGESQQIDGGNGVNSHSIEVRKNEHEQNDLGGERISQHEKENPEIKSAEGNAESACSSLLSNCTNVPYDPDNVRGRTATRTESRLRKQSCPNFKDRPVSQMDNEKKLDNTHCRQSLKPVTGNSKQARKLSGPDKAFSKALRTDLKRVKENGRLVFYFRSPERPRSLSPNYRLTSDGTSRKSIGLDSSEMTSRKSSDVTSRKSSAQSSIFSPSPNEKLRAGVAALRDLYKEHYAVYSGRPWSAGAAR